MKHSHEHQHYSPYGMFRHKHEHGHDPRKALADENAELRKELQDQWEENHFEHCSRDWPHPEGKICFWPYPTVLGKLENLSTPEAAS